MASNVVAKAVLCIVNNNDKILFMQYNMGVQVRTIRGIYLPWEERERYGSERLYTSGPKAGQSMYPDREKTGTVIATGVVFVSAEVLEELVEVDNSFGMGGAYLCGYREGMALEQAGLVIQETRGGYYTDVDEREKLNLIIEQLYSESFEQSSDKSE